MRLWWMHTQSRRRKYWKFNRQTNHGLLFLLEFHSLLLCCWSLSSSSIICWSSFQPFPPISRNVTQFLLQMLMLITLEWSGSSLFTTNAHHPLHDATSTSFFWSLVVRSIRFIYFKQRICVQISLSRSIVANCLIIITATWHTVILKCNLERPVIK